MGRPSLPLPGWILALAIPAFIATWILAPRETFSGTTFGGPPPLPPRDVSKDAPPIDPPWERSAPAELRTVLGLERPGEIALTFDDGPHPANTSRLLDILERHGVRAAFFINGYWLSDRRRSGERAAAVVRRAHAAGHIIANHSYSHAMIGLSPEAQAFEILANHELITRLTGERPTLFRPPYAVTPRHARALLRELGYSEVLWSATAPDQEMGDPALIASTVMGWLRAYNGGIVMLHDRNRQSVEAVELVLRALERENCRRSRRGQQALRVVPLDSLLRPPPQSWALSVEPARHGEGRHACADRL